MADETYKAPGTYEVDEAVHLETADRFGERYEVDLKAGKHKPKSEREEHALEHLVSIGKATGPEGRRWTSPVTVEEPTAEPELEEGDE
jgi:hypothetical protein